MDSRPNSRIFVKYWDHGNIKRLIIWNIWLERTYLIPGFLWEDGNFFGIIQTILEH